MNDFIAIGKDIVRYRDLLGRKPLRDRPEGWWRYHMPGLRRYQDALRRKAERTRTH